MLYYDIINTYNIIYDRIIFYPLLPGFGEKQEGERERERDKERERKRERQRGREEERQRGRGAERQAVRKAGEAGPGQDFRGGSWLRLKYVILCCIVL